MPIEREFKYLLRDADILWDRLNPLTHSGLIVGKANIEQAYLSKGGRIRKRSWERYRCEASDLVERIFTYKLDLSNQPGALEIETLISEDDYNLAWSEADHKLKKTRFILPCNNTSGVWEIDFFHDDAGIYLALAEFEVPADAGPPSKLQPLVQEFLLYSVEEGDIRFANRKLSTRERVEELLKEIV